LIIDDSSLFVCDINHRMTLNNYFSDFETPTKFREFF
jgi:hypothetical protein